ncbi:hypothetical protein EW026_g2320 [Hermanssonia centrifuga]|uniref:Uncharacterized protein n=1 Tax=Hermanssonia centrifuga TaxID=98765 RepID=A0A4S4KTB8_9APHY|nr:hypothetical protein EW026_g2320 [Hermanssonia centrifuga]
MQRYGDIGGENSAPRAAAVESTAYHTVLNAVPCDKDGKSVPSNAQPASVEAHGNWEPFKDRIAFETAEFLYKEEQMSQTKISKLMDLWAASLLEHGGTPPFSSHAKMYKTIDSIAVGEVPWQTFSVKYAGEVPDGVTPSWMLADYDIHYRDPDLIARQRLDNSSFKDGFDPIPRRDFDRDGGRVYKDFMSGNWAWTQADLLAENPNNEGAMVVPLVFGSDKTTVSVATGQNDYYPLYMSSGVITNAYRRAHCNSVVPIAFLATPKCARKYDKCPIFQKFRWKLFHKSLAFIMRSLKPGMTTKQLVRCPDRHYRHALYCLGPYIADYPEQILLAGVVSGWCPKCMASKKNLDAGTPGRRTRELTDMLIEAYDTETVYKKYGIHAEIVPFTNDFPRADIHELLAPDLLHQIIKGTFKDHLVTWVGEYLTHTHGETAGNTILDDIDRRIAAAPSFPGLRRFPEGRRFKQWTGDDSKALMKVRAYFFINIA